MKKTETNQNNHPTDRTIENTNTPIIGNEKMPTRSSSKTKLPSNLDLVSSLSNTALSKRAEVKPLAPERLKETVPTITEEKTGNTGNTRKKINHKSSKLTSKKSSQTRNKKSSQQQQAPLAKQLASASSDTGYPIELSSIYNNKVTYARKAVKLDKRVIDSIIKNTLELNLPLYRIIELILIKHCLTHYPSTSNEMNNLLTQLRGNQA